MGHPLNCFVVFAGMATIAAPGKRGSSSDVLQARG
jgi:hypothetical protein